MAGTVKIEQSPFELTEEDYVPTFGGNFAPFEAKVRIEQVMTRTASTGAPQLGVMVRLLHFSEEELAMNSSRKNKYTNRVAWGFKAFNGNQTEQFLDIAGDQISRVIGKQFKISAPLSAKHVEQLAKKLGGVESTGTAWIVSGDNGESLEIWKSQASAVESAELRAATAEPF